jgi:hypothetical protein
MSSQTVPVELDNDALRRCQRNVKVSFVVVVAGWLRRKKKTFESQWMNLGWFNFLSINIYGVEFRIHAEVGALFWAN